MQQIAACNHGCFLPCPPASWAAHQLANCMDLGINTRRPRVLVSYHQVMREARSKYVYAHCTGPGSIPSIKTGAAAHLRQHGLHDGVVRCDLGTASVGSGGPRGGAGCLLAALCPNGVAVGLRLRLAAGCRAGKSVRLLYRLSHLHSIPRQQTRAALSRPGATDAAFRLPPRPPQWPSRLDFNSQHRLQGPSHICGCRQAPPDAQRTTMLGSPPAAASPPLSPLIPSGTFSCILSTHTARTPRGCV